jgi:DNA polymerase-3 subunit delta'
MNIKDLPWLQPQQALLRGVHAAGRLAHALFIHEAPGAGGDVLASWVAELVLCTAAQPPCHRCPGCRRAAADAHPDLIRLQPLEDSRQIRIEQVRELAASLALTSYHGGYKVAIVSPADALNRAAANALLKTLEEPTPRTLLVLVASQPSKLPATLLSRCQRIPIPAPARAAAVTWLQELRGPGDWAAALATLGDAALYAAEADPGVLAAFAAETHRVLDETLEQRADPVTTAERWWRTDLPLRLVCIENWLTDRIRGHFAVRPFSVERSVEVDLQRTSILGIRRLFGLVDQVQEMKSLLDAPLNRSLALESLLRGLAAQ